jgi:hypothetical protein
MSKRICILEYCDDCPYFDNEYYGYNQRCVKLNRVIERGGDSSFGSHYEIPIDCPLEQFKEGE